MDAVATSLYTGCIEGFTNAAKWADTATAQLDRPQVGSAPEAIQMAFERHGAAWSCYRRLPKPLRTEIDQRAEQRAAFDAINRLNERLTAMIKAAK